MSMIALGLNLFLAVLLLAALVLGWRLNRRLKALRDSHDSFAKAVQELNWAAQRAEQGLADLRSATDEAADSLADRIEKARDLVVQLDRLAEQPIPAPRAAAARAPAPREPELRLAEPRGERLGALLSQARTSRPRTAAEAAERVGGRVLPPARSRSPRMDDDLFDEPLELGPLNALGGARR
jgi:hypothetical protein